MRQTDRQMRTVRNETQLPRVERFSNNYGRNGLGVLQLSLVSQSTISAKSVLSSKNEQTNGPGDLRGATVPGGRWFFAFTTVRGVRPSTMLHYSGRRASVTVPGRWPEGTAPLSVHHRPSAATNGLTTCLAAAADRQNTVVIMMHQLEPPVGTHSAFSTCTWVLPVHALYTPWAIKNVPLYLRS